MTEGSKRELERRLARNGMKLVVLNRGPWLYAIDDTAGRRITRPVTLTDGERFATFLSYQEGDVVGPEQDPKHVATPPQPQPTAPERRWARIVLDSEEEV